MLWDVDNRVTQLPQTQSESFDYTMPYSTDTKQNDFIRIIELVDCTPATLLLDFFILMLMDFFTFSGFENFGLMLGYLQSLVLF